MSKTIFAYRLWRLWFGILQAQDEGWTIDGKRLSWFSVHSPMPNTPEGFKTFSMVFGLYQVSFFWEPAA